MAKTTRSVMMTISRTSVVVVAGGSRCTSRWGPSTDIWASESEWLGCAPRAVSRIDVTWSIAAVLNGSSFRFDEVVSATECPSGEMNILAALFESRRRVSTLGGMYMPAIEFL